MAINDFRSRSVMTPTQLRFAHKSRVVATYLFCRFQRAQIFKFTTFAYTIISFISAVHNLHMNVHM